MQGCGSHQTVWRQLDREMGSRAPNQATASVEGAVTYGGRLLTHRPTSSSRGQCLRYQAGLRPAGARAGDFAGQIAAALSRGEIELNCPLDTVSDIGECSSKDTVGLHTTVICLFCKVYQFGFGNKSLFIQPGCEGLQLREFGINLTRLATEFLRFLGACLNQKGRDMPKI